MLALTAARPTRSSAASRRCCAGSAATTSTRWRPATTTQYRALLVGSEGTLAFFTEIELELQPIPPHRVLGICHFPTFYQAMDATQHIVELGPTAVELVDRTMIELARDNPMFRPAVDRFVQGEPDAMLLTEFAGDDPRDNLRRLKQLVELMGDLGFLAGRWGGVIEATDLPPERGVEMRKEGLNIMMSMKGDGKPVSFIEDCAVRLEDLAEYTDRLTQVFQKHGTTAPGTRTPRSAACTCGRSST